MNVPSLFGDLLLDGVIYWCHWRWRRRWDVGLACRYRGFLGWDDRLLGWSFWLACGRSDPSRRQRGLGRRRGRRSHCRLDCCRFGNVGEDSPLGHRRADGCGGPPLIDIRDAVVVIRRWSAWIWGVDYCLRDGWKNKKHR